MWSKIFFFSFLLLLLLPPQPYCLSCSHNNTTIIWYQSRKKITLSRAGVPKTRTFCNRWLSLPLILVGLLMWTDGIDSMLPLDGHERKRNDCKQTSLACVSSDASLYRCTDHDVFFSDVQEFFCLHSPLLIDCFCFLILSPIPNSPQSPESRSML